MLERIREASVPANLYMGIAGVGMVFLRAGLVELAQELLSLTRWTTLRDCPGLYHGCAGWGLVNLHYWIVTGESLYLRQAVEIGDHLIASQENDETGSYWRDRGAIPLGLGFGASGISLFLLYLSVATGEPTYLSLAEQALAFDMARAYRLGNRLLYHNKTEVSVRAPKSPHMRHGTVGVGTAAIRMYAATKNDIYLRFAEQCAYTCSSRNTNKLWQDYGKAGFGEFLLDMYRFSREQKYLDNAYYQAEGILPYQIEHADGIAFPGSELLRISCDFGMGSAGIGMFFHRLLHPEKDRLFMLDSLLGEETAGSEMDSIEYASFSRPS